MRRSLRGTGFVLVLLGVAAADRPAVASARQAPKVAPSLPLRQVLTCVPTVSTQYVRAGVNGGDGSRARPLRTVAEGLARAAAANACDVVVELGPGTYAEPFALDRNTTLRGSGRDATVLRAPIELRAGRRLALEQLSLRATTGPAVVVTHAAAKADLKEVTIDAASRHAVRQSGGTLSLAGVTVSGTLGGPTLFDGAAIHLEGGAQATLEDVRLTGNRHGIVALGGGTKVTARRLEVSGGSSAYRTAETADREEGRGLGAVEVRGALLLVEDSRIADNTGIGLLVAERGRLHARRVAIAGSRSLPDGDEFRAWGGINLALNRAQAQLVDVTSSDASIGLVSWQTELYSRGLQLRDLEIGMGLTSTDEPGRVAECLGDVRVERVAYYAEFRRPSGALAVPPGPGGEASFVCHLDPERPECQSRTGTFRPCLRVPWD